MLGIIQDVEDIMGNKIEALTSEFNERNGLNKTITKGKT